MRPQLLASLLAGLGPALPAFGSEPHPVTARLWSDRQATSPGDRMQLAVELDLAPGWHVYWSNPGDSGLPTTVALRPQVGIRAGDALLPVPERHVEEGDVLVFGYGEDLGVVVPIEIDPAVRPGTRLRLRARVEWLVCKQACLPGSADLEGWLPVREAARPANRERFAAWEEGLPRAIPGAEPQVQAPGPDGRGGLSVTLPEGSRNPEVFPGSAKGVGIEDLDLTGSDGTVEVGWTVRLWPDEGKAPAALPSLLAFEDARGRRRALPFDLPVQ